MRIAIIAASPSSTSRSNLIAMGVARYFANADIEITTIPLVTLPVEAMVLRREGELEIERALAQVAKADGVVVVTPIYKASFSGLLKIFLDLLPQSGFDGKTVLPLAVGGSLAHVLALDYGLRPVLQSMRARHVVRSHFLLDNTLAQTIGPDGSIDCDELRDVVGEFADALSLGPLRTRSGTVFAVAS